MVSLYEHLRVGDGVLGVRSIHKFHLPGQLETLKVR